MIVTQEYLQKVLHYDPVTGEFHRLISTTNSVKPGDKAGTINGNGYLTIMVGGRLHQAHRLAWLFMAGTWPEHQIDHINEVKTDNRWVNLRAATNAENRQNMHQAQANNKTGLRGVSWDKDAKKFKAQIKINGKKKSIGRFATAQDAHAAYVEAKNKFHPFGMAFKNG